MLDPGAKAVFRRTWGLFLSLALEQSTYAAPAPFNDVKMDCSWTGITRRAPK
jgi:hypothetical protein